VVGPDSSVVDPTKFVEITTVWVVKIVNWLENDGGEGWTWKGRVQEGRWSGCQSGRTSVKRFGGGEEVSNRKCR
jgi:hypothetical protein